MTTSYKTKMCRVWEEKGACDRPQCGFAHGRAELRSAPADVHGRAMEPFSRKKSAMLVAESTPHRARQPHPHPPQALQQQVAVIATPRGGSGAGHPPQALQQQVAVIAAPRGGSGAGGVLIEQRLQCGGKEKFEVSQHRRQLLLSCAMDVSGSMSGAPSKALLAMFEDLCRNVLSPRDLLACCTFADEVKKLHAAMPLEKVDVDKDLKHIAANAGGRTALWDGVYWAVEKARFGCKTLREKSGAGHEDPLVECLIITDGADNSSKKTSLEELLPMLAHPGMPNFNLVVVGVGDVDQDALKRLCEGKQNAHFLYAKDMEAFKKTLAQVVDRIKIKLTRETRGSSLTVEWNGSRADAPAALQRVAKNGESAAAHLLSAAPTRSLLLGGPAAAAAIAQAPTRSKRLH